MGIRIGLVNGESYYFDASYQAIKDLINDESAIAIEIDEAGKKRLFLKSAICLVEEKIGGTKMPKVTFTRDEIA